jgi:hypothetical protein
MSIVNQYPSNVSYNIHLIQPQPNINLTRQPAFTSNYSNKNTRELNQQLNNIGKPEKTFSNILRTFTPGSKSKKFLDKITEIIIRINPENSVEYNPDNHKKIIKIQKLLSEFKSKKTAFPDLIRIANQIQDNIKEMIKIFEEKEAINKLELDEEIKIALKGQIRINESGLTRNEIYKKYKQTIMVLYKKFLDKYIQNYKLAIESTSNFNKKDSMEKIDLLNKVRPFFYKNYWELLKIKDEESLKKESEIELLKKQIDKNFNDILQKYHHISGILHPNKSKPIVTIPNQNKPLLSEELVKLATRIYELALITKDLSKFKLLKDMLADLYYIYSIIFIESQINKNKGQKIGNFTGPYSNTFINLRKKKENLNNKSKNTISINQN